jgi:hypothetical protein
MDDKTKKVLQAFIDAVREMEIRDMPHVPGNETPYCLFGEDILELRDSINASIKKAQDELDGA